MRNSLLLKFDYTCIVASDIPIRDARRRAICRPSRFGWLALKALVVEDIKTHLYQIFILYCPRIYLTIGYVDFRKTLGREEGFPKGLHSCLHIGRLCDVFSHKRSACDIYSHPTNIDGYENPDG